MPPKFGTSGLRGLVKDLNRDVVAGYVAAFASCCRTGGVVHVGYDLRPSSPAIAADVMAAINDAGLTAINHGAIPTPALARVAISQGHSAIMITGSHIPADRNGLKFYLPKGEIDKLDEAAITASYKPAAFVATKETPPLAASDAAQAYVSRYVDTFGASALSGLRIGIYEHSSVARDLMGSILRGLGAVAVPLARSDVFVPVDTEAVDPATRTMFTTWATVHALDAIVSTDGDGDRPMVAGPDGTIVAGDVLGPLTAIMLDADTVVTPITSNGLIDRMDHFTTLRRTRIGSPFVIAEMEDIMRQNPQAKVVGYEANGGFILGFDAIGPSGRLPRLMTRDSMLPIIAPLVEARARRLSLSELVATLPACYTASGLVRDVPTARSSDLIDRLSTDPAARAAFFSAMGTETAIDRTDGLRLTFDDSTIVHLRPSGNAPECRCYAQADDPLAAQDLVDTTLRKLAAAFE